jgi:hypothetical protein
MNRDDVKNILLLYRPDAVDIVDPDVTEALALAKQDAELSDWFRELGTRQEILRAKFRQIQAPAGLKEQIISEQAAREKIVVWRRTTVFAAIAAAVVVLLTLAVFRLQPLLNDNTLALYQNRMVGAALRVYTMDLATDDPAKIRDYLKQNHAPADYILPAPLEKVATTGCAITSWQGAKVSMICFRTGKALPPGEQSDLWLFVIDRSLVKNAPPAGPPQLAKVNRLITATWTQGDKLYLLGTEGDEQTIRQLL